MTEPNGGLVRFRALGGIELKRTDGVDVDRILRQPKRLALLAYLALASPRGFHRRDVLLALLWPELDQAAARHALRNALYNVRREVGEVLITSRGTEEVGVTGDALWCDAIEFEQALDERDPERALELYGGELLHGFHVTGSSPQFGDWLDRERVRLRLRAADAAWELASAFERTAKMPRAVGAAHAALALRPDDEPWLRKVLALLYRLGDQAGALRAYEEFAARLSKEFEVEPAPETRALIRQVRERRPTAPEYVMPRRSSGADRQNAESPPAAAPSPAPDDTRYRVRVVALVVLAAAAILAFVVLR